MMPAGVSASAPRWHTQRPHENIQAMNQGKHRHIRSAALALPPVLHAAQEKGKRTSAENG
jgi:hypothetical protein